MRRPRTSIAGLMAAVVIVSLVLVALRSHAPVWAGATFLATCGVLALAVVGAVCRGGAGRAWWLGFALFGSGYLALVSWPDAARNLPTRTLLSVAMPLFQIKPGFKGLASAEETAFSQVGHSLFALMAAIIGGGLSLALFGPAQAIGRVRGRASAGRPPAPASMAAACGRRACGIRRGLGGRAGRDPMGTGAFGRRGVLRDVGGTDPRDRRAPCSGRAGVVRRGSGRRCSGSAT